MGIIIALFWIVSGVVLLLTFFFFLEIVFSIPVFQPRKKCFFDQELAQKSRAAILIPAHNEEDVIEQTLLSIIPQLRDGDEVIVVADNCSDNTKSVAEKQAVTVLERSDKENRGKGFALDFALNSIKDKDFDAILMVDADCILGDACRDHLVSACLQTSRPIQCLYLMYSQEEDPSLSKRISEFAWRIKNKLRPIGLGALGGPCQLMGTGMAFPKGMLNDVQLATGCIVEDMKLGLDLATQGKAPLFLSDVLVSSYFPSDEQVGEGQKKRWIHGHLEMIVKYVPSLLKAAVTQKQWQALLLCLDLMILPLIMFLFLVIAVGFLLMFLSLLLGASFYIAALFSFVFIGLALSIAWLLAGRDLLTIKELAEGFISRVKSASVYFDFFTNRLKSWNKTSRK